MKEQNIQPDIFTANLFLKKHVQQGEVDAAQGIRF